jgi:adenine-specific DNA-methyltransferase
MTGMKSALHRVGIAKSSLLDTVSVPSIDDVRAAANNRLDPKRRVALGQFMTPSVIARFMASMFQKWPKRIDLLDPGAGVGSLSEAFDARFLENARPDSVLSIGAYEIEPMLVGYLNERLMHIESVATARAQKIRSEVVERDFIREGAFALAFGGARYTHAILNPPYKKIGANSEYRLLLRKEGIETVNLYTAFMALAIGLTKEGGEIVAIIPRSFCNGTYFRPFRHWLLERVALRHIHVFESRKKAFRTTMCSKKISLCDLNVAASTMK